jgi:hypothetical protein
MTVGLNGPGGWLSEDKPYGHSSLVEAVVHPLKQACLSSSTSLMKSLRLRTCGFGS